MNHSNILLTITLLLSLLFFNSCKKDAVCTQEEFIGNWSGPGSCDQGTENLFSIEILLDGDQLVAKYVGNTLSTTLENCKLKVFGEFSHGNYDIEGELKDGELHVSISKPNITFGQISCDVVMKRL